MVALAQGDGTGIAGIPDAECPGDGMGPWAVAGEGDAVNSFFRRRIRRSPG
jgi:hypothetical protein